MQKCTTVHCSFQHVIICMSANNFPASTQFALIKFTNLILIWGESITAFAGTSCQNKFSHWTNSRFCTFSHETHSPLDRFIHNYKRRSSDGSVFFSLSAPASKTARNNNTTNKSEKEAITGLFSSTPTFHSRRKFAKAIFRAPQKGRKVCAMGKMIYAQ